MIHGILTTFLSIFLFVSGTAIADQPTAEQLVSKVDKHVLLKSFKAQIHMTVVRPIGTAEYKLGVMRKGSAWGMYTFTAPQREKNTSLIWARGDFYRYMPAAHRAVRYKMRDILSGRGVVSDATVDLIMGSEGLRDGYTATLSGEDTVDGRACWKVALLAKGERARYKRRTVWIDKEWLIPIKEEMFSSTDVMVKRIQVVDVTRTNAGHMVPSKMVVESSRPGHSTTLVFSECESAFDISEDFFTLENQKRWRP